MRCQSVTEGNPINSQRYRPLRLYSLQYCLQTLFFQNPRAVASTVEPQLYLSERSTFAFAKGVEVIKANLLKAKFYFCCQKVEVEFIAD